MTQSPLLSPFHPSLFLMDHCISARVSSAFSPPSAQPYPASISITSTLLIFKPPIITIYTSVMSSDLSPPFFLCAGSKLILSYSEPVLSGFFSALCLSSQQAGTAPEWWKTKHLPCYCLKALQLSPTLYRCSFGYLALKTGYSGI